MLMEKEIVQNLVIGVELNLVNQKIAVIGFGSQANKVIKYLKKYNFDTLDFNGANSPNRSDDKHSYGTDYKLYFQLKY